MSDQQIISLLEGIRARLDRLIQLKEEQVYPESQFKPMVEQPLRSPDTLEPTSDSPPLAQSIQSLEQALASEGVDTSLLEIGQDKTTVKPIRFLGDLWAKPNDVLKTMGYTWVSDGKNSRWMLGDPPPNSSTSTTWKSFKKGKGEWAFAKDRQGNLHPETANLYNELMELGQAKVVGKYRYRISGDNNEFLQRFSAT